MKAKGMVLAGAGFLALTLVPSLTASAEGAPEHDHGTVVTVEKSPAGWVLVVGGEGAGHIPGTSTFIYPAGSSLYSPTIDPLVNPHSDDPYKPGCDATTLATSVLEEQNDPAISGPPFPPFTCAGPETDPTADWPALTTDGPPVAGPGVDRELLGSVYRTDLKAYQVTYGGHPLYLFDPGPNSFAGEDFFETVPPLFPWHTAWYLVSPDGRFDPGQANLTTEAPQAGTVYTSTVLANTMLPAIGGLPTTVYSSSSDDDPGSSECLGACAMEWIPVLTKGTPAAGAGVDGGDVGTITRPDGTRQVTYHGKPLYMSTDEQAFLGTTGPATAGNGAGVHQFGGTFSSVSP